MRTLARLNAMTRFVAAFVGVFVLGAVLSLGANALADGWDDRGNTHPISTLINLGTANSGRVAVTDADGLVLTNASAPIILGATGHVRWGAADATGCLFRLNASGTLIARTGADGTNCHLVGNEITSAGATFRFGGGGTYLVSSSGSPEAVQAIGQGSGWMRTNGDDNTSLYIKSGGTTTSSGWRPVQSAASQSVTCADTGDANPCTTTVNPTAALVLYTCNDTHTCDVTLGETGLGSATNFVVRHCNVSTNSVDFADSAGVSETSGALNLGQYDCVEFTYLGDRWAQSSAVQNN